ncbi:hypothetical protein [Sphingosinicella rhizophila]|uniref:Uncharacterized protein n=1 Tax=Sphingosinicella rhizophila TaxID=3050082 RepID=A0ABU3Q9L5_9SPHN|nr:hypothetical protein [Sphingosinicella sp. GR2756]MDT9600082.1 hypothetical protein [Sphingosinicella sp. GR2756]
MKDDARSYFRDRAETELQAGRSAAHPEAAKAHFLLAGFYFDRTFNSVAESGETDHAPG